MSPEMLHLAHQALFGGVAAAGFALLFNCPPRILVLGFFAGALTLTIRTLGQDYGLSLPMASFLAALGVSVADRIGERAGRTHGALLTVVGCIPMIPGSLAAKALMGFFGLSLNYSADSAKVLDTAVSNAIVVSLTVVALGIGLSIPRLVFPEKR